MLPENPYKPSAYIPPEAPPDYLSPEQVRAKLTVPAVLMLITCVPGILFSLYGIGAVIYVATVADNMAMLSGSLVYVVMLLGNLTTLWGSICMLRTKSWKVAFAGAMLAVAPFCSPCWVLGIPFGIWSLLVLGQPEVKAVFR